MQDEDYPPSRHRLPHADEAPWEYLGISKTEWVVQVVRYIDGFNADCDDDISDGFPPEPETSGSSTRSRPSCGIASRALSRLLFARRRSPTSVAEVMAGMNWTSAHCIELRCLSPKPSVRWQQQKAAA